MGKSAARKKARNWTVMLYMVAADDVALDGFAVRDLKEIERATRHGDVRVKVQIFRHWPSQPQRYEIRGGTTLLSPDVVVHTNSGSADALAEFLDWATKDDRDSQTFLVLWGHAFGLGFGRHHGDALGLHELRLALARFKKLRGAALDLLGANACAMSYAEAAVELGGCADYLVASQIAVPFAGWPYDSILGRITSSMPPAEVGCLVVDQYVSHFEEFETGDQAAMSLLNLANVANLQTHVTALAKAIVAGLASNDPGAADRRRHVRATFLSTVAGDVRPLIDVHDLAQSLIALCDDLRALEGSPFPLEEVRSHAEVLRDFVAPPPTPRGAAVLPPDADDRLVLVLKQQRGLDGLNGLGIFAPFVTDARDLARLGLSLNNVDSGREAYHALKFIQRNPWEGLVFDTLSSDLPDEVVAGIVGSAAATRADRAAVAQMLASVDSTFAVLDRRIAAVQAMMRDILPALAGSAAGQMPGVRSNPLARLQLLLEAAPPSTPAPAGGPSPAAAGPGLGPAAGPGLGPAAGPGLGPSSQPAWDDAIEALEALERMVAQVERSVRRTLTNGRFGLGPPAEGGKPGLGDPSEGPKPKLGAPEEGPKPKLGAPSEGGKPEPRCRRNRGHRWRDRALAARHHGRALRLGGGVAATPRGDDVGLGAARRSPQGCGNHGAPGAAGGDAAARSGVQRHVRCVL